MNKRKRRFLIFTGAATLFILGWVFILLLLLPTLVNLEGVRKRITIEASRQLGGEVEIEELKVAYLPTPHIDIVEGKFVIPKKVEFSSKSLSLYPRIMPLFHKKVELKRVSLDSPLIVVHLKKRSPEEKAPPLEEKIGVALSLLAKRLPSLKVEIHGGELSLVSPDEAKAPIWMRGITGHIVYGFNRLKVSLKFSSSLSQEISLKSDLDIEKIEGTLKLALIYFKPHKLALLLMRRTPLNPVDSNINLTLNAHLHGLKEMEVAFHGDVPCLAFQPEGKRKMIMECGQLKGSLKRSEHKLKVSLDALELRYPGLKLSGWLEIDASKEHPQAALQVKGEDVNVKSVREVALNFLGEDKTVRKIFRIVRGGMAKEITYTFQGKKLKGAGKLNNILIRGELQQGTVVIPNNLLTVEQAGGEVEISKGTLRGKNLVGNVGKAHGSEGSLVLGLRGKEAPFHLEMKVKTDLDMVPDILKKFVKHRGFLRELALFKDVKGKAIGRLILGETINSIQPLIDLDHFAISSAYARIPYSVRITSGSFHYQKEYVSCENVIGKLGNSRFEKLTARLALSSPMTLKVDSMSGVLVMDELYPWLFSYKVISDVLKDFKGLKGRVMLSGLKMKGPLFRPAQWKFSLKGEVSDVKLDYSFFPDILKVKRGKINVDEVNLSFHQCDATVLDSSLMASGVLNDYIKGLKGIELKMDGRAHAKLAQWVYKLTDLSQEYRLKAPFDVKGGYLKYNSKETTFKGDLSLGERGSLSVDLGISPNMVQARRIIISNKEERCRLGVSVSPHMLKLSFKGKISRATLDGMLEKNLILKGWASGDFSLHMDLEAPGNSKAWGTLKVEGLEYLWGLKMPVMIERAAVNAQEKHIELGSFSISSKESSIGGSGSLDFSSERYLINLDAFSPYLAWADIESILLGESSSEKGKDAKIGGVIKLRALKFRYKDFVWDAIHAKLYLKDGEYRVVVDKADLCGMSTPGMVKYANGELSLSFSVKTADGDMDNTLTCFFEQKGLIEGKYSLDGQLYARGKEEPLAEHSKGKFHLYAEKGRIYRFNILSKILSVLNLMEISRGKVPDLTKEGFSYEKMEGEAVLKNGIIFIKEGVIDGSPMKIFTQGKVDAIKEELDLTVLVAPFKTVDVILRNIPLLGRVLTGKSGTFISVPLSVKGNWKDPKVIPIPPKAVGSGLLGIMKRTLELPVEVIKPVIPKETPPEKLHEE